MNYRQWSRRQFLQQTTGAAGASLAARSIWLEADPIGAAPRSVPPSDRVRFGIIGMEGTGLLSTAIQLPGVKCVAASDLYDGRHQHARETVGKPIHTTRRYKELLDNKEIDCIVAAVPDHWHKQVVVDAVSAGKDIYCEKPMSHSVNEGFEMVAAAQKSGRIVQIGAQRTSSVLCAKARELYQKGAIGELCLVEATMGRNDPTPGSIRRRPTCHLRTWIGIPGSGPPPKASFPPRGFINQPRVAAKLLPWYRNLDISYSPKGINNPAQGCGPAATLG